MFAISAVIDIRIIKRKTVEKSRINKQGKAKELHKNCQHKQSRGIALV